MQELPVTDTPKNDDQIIDAAAEIIMQMYREAFEELAK